MVLIVTSSNPSLGPCDLIDLHKKTVSWYKLSHLATQAWTHFLHALAGLSSDCLNWISRPGLTHFLHALAAIGRIVLRLLKLNIKARHDIPEFLTANLLSIHVIALDIDWSWNFFTWNNFLLNVLIEQLIKPIGIKLRIENLKFRTNLPDWLTDGWSVTK